MADEGKKLVAFAERLAKWKRVDAGLALIRAEQAQRAADKALADCGATADACRDEAVAQVMKAQPDYDAIDVVEYAFDGVDNVCESCGAHRTDESGMLAANEEEDVLWFCADCIADGIVKPDPVIDDAAEACDG